VTQDTSTRMYDSATNLYLGWIDASLTANERLARVARVWIDETLGVQQDLAQAMKQAMTETQSALAQDGEPVNPMTWIGRSSDLARTAAYHWTEAALKAQERYTRIAQTAFDEMRSVQADITSRAEEQISEFTRSVNGRTVNATS
jgi:hypothetical protein